MIDAAFDSSKWDPRFQLQWTLLRLTCAAYQSEGQDQKYTRGNRTRCPADPVTSLVYLEPHDGEILALNSASRYLASVVIAPRSRPLRRPTPLNTAIPWKQG